MQIADRIGCRLRRDTPENPRGGLNQCDLKPELAGDRSRLQPDIAAADHDEPRACTELCLHPVYIGQTSHGIDAFQRAPHISGQAPWRGSGADHKIVIAQLLATEPHLLLRRINRLNARPQPQGDPMLVPEILPAQGQPLQRHIAQQIGLGERWPLIRGNRLLAQKGDIALIPQTAELRCG